MDNFGIYIEGMIMEKDEPLILDEIANAVTHGFGVVLSIAGLVLMIVYSALN